MSRTAPPRPDLTVVVPTFNRPDGLSRAVLSLFAQTYADAPGFTLVIVDNTPEATAAGAIETLRKVCPPRVRLVTLHEPAPGVANARNTAMAGVDTDLVAFLDDDQSAPEDWLERLLDCHARYPAPVTFGPVVTALPPEQKRHRAYFASFFAREPDLPLGYTDQSYGCGNALVDFGQIKGQAPWFDTAMNEIGGEDDRLFERVRRQGGRFAWAANAPVFEHPLPSRINLSYTLRRAFAYGQGPITLARMAVPPRRLEVAKWMAIGAGKGLMHGLAWAGLFLVRHPRRAYQLDLCVRGVAKVFWFVDFRFYGRAALAKQTQSQRLRPGHRQAETSKADAP